MPVDPSALAEAKALIADHRVDRARTLGRLVWFTAATLVLPVWMATTGGEDATRKAMMFAVLPAAMIILALANRRTMLRQIDDAARLLERPDELVWVHPIATRTSVNGIGVGTFQSVAMVTATRGYGELRALRARFAPVYAALQRALPHATFGYSDELAARCRRDPASLRVVAGAG